MANTIEYLEGWPGRKPQTWNPMTGCLGPYSTGCQKCWARRFHTRLRRPMTPVFYLDRLRQPLHWKTPRIVATCFSGDIGDAPRLERGAIAEIIDQTPQHVYLLLSKQPRGLVPFSKLENVMLGTSCESDQDERLEDLRVATIGLRWVSLEPLLGPLGASLQGLDWVTVGCETGPGARPCRPEWIASIVELCRLHRIPCYVKKIAPGVPFEAWPKELQVRELPGIAYGNPDK
jgi:protein gp37